MGGMSLCTGRQIEQCKNTKIKYVLGLGGCCNISHVTTNINMWAQWSGYMRAGATRGEHARGMKPSFWGALEVERR
jgi:hypothetical protein